jgi:prepilin-type N-terminal cleavage/methylation domain-containing protein
VSRRSSADAVAADHLFRVPARARPRVRGTIGGLRREEQIMSRTRRTGFTLIELLVVISIIALLVGILMPGISKARDSALVMKSMANLRNFGAAHAVYASEWNGRQWTTCPDDLSTMISNYSENYNAFPQIPAVPLGFDRFGVHWQTKKGWAIQHFTWTGNCSLGNFRYFHTKPFNQYINKKVYDQIFWAPKDTTINDRINQWIEDPGEWPSTNNDGQNPTIVISTYATSVAAQESPDVFRGPQDGGSQHPLSLPAGHRTPNLSSAIYPDLKSHMLEHRWLQNPPSPSIPGTAGVPWFYNMGPDSTPATLFFDSSVRMKSTREAVASSNRVVQQGEDKLDAIDVSCFGSGGYFQNYGYSGANQRGEINSWHIFTRDGIKGRDFTQ